MLAFSGLFLLCAPIGAQAPAPRDAQTRLLDRRVLAFFEGMDRSPERAPAELAALVGRHPSPLLDALSALQPGGPTPFAAPPAGGDGTEAILLAALERVPGQAVTPLIDARIAAGPVLSELFALCKALERCSDAATVPRAIALAEAAGAQLADERMQDVFEDALAAALVHPAEVHCLRRSWEDLPEEALAAAVRALAVARDPAALELATERLALDPDLTPELLSAIGTLGALGEPRARLAAADAVLWHLRRCQSPTEIQAVVVCLDRLGDDCAVPELLPLLESADEGVRRTVWRALCRLTGLGYPPEREPWEAWFGEEERWFDARAPELFAALDSPRLEEAVAAIQEISAHRLHREALVEVLAHALSDERRDVRLQACIAHQRLKRRSSLPWLEELRTDPDAVVSQAADRAVRAIKGVGQRGPGHSLGSARE